jgi:hypothetical protein
VSEDVLDGIARALQLDEAERTHLNDLVRTANTLRPARRRPSQERVRSTVQRILDAMTDAPAYVRNGRLEVLAANRLGAALFSEALAQPQQPPNLARFAFLSPQAARFWTEWDSVANDTVAILRAEAGRDPYDRRLTDPIGELSTRSDEFRRRWAAHDVTLHRSGVKQFHHPVVGDLTLAYEALELPGDVGQRINVYTAEPGSPSADALGLLASWAATPHPQSTAPDADCTDALGQLPPS